MDIHMALCGNMDQISPWIQVAAQSSGMDVHHPLITAHRHEQGFRLQHRHQTSVWSLVVPQPMAIKTAQSN